MSTAPRDGTLLRLWLHDGIDFTGYYSTRFWGWVAYHDPYSLVRGYISFHGWGPVEQERKPVRSTW